MKPFRWLTVLICFPVGLLIPSAVKAIDPFFLAQFKSPGQAPYRVTIYSATGDRLRTFYVAGYTHNNGRWTFVDAPNHQTIEASGTVIVEPNEKPYVKETDLP